MSPASAGCRPSRARCSAAASRSKSLYLADIEEFWQTLQGSFSAVSTPLIARVGAVLLASIGFDIAENEPYKVWAEPMIVKT